MNRLTFKKNLGIHSSLHQNFHHQIVFAKFNLKVSYPPPYEREVWHFKKANTDHIKRAINGFPWERSFANLDINDKVYLFNKTIKNILSVSYLMKLLLAHLVSRFACNARVIVDASSHPPVSRLKLL